VSHAIGMDVGGTFTDIVGVSDTGALSISKVSTQPADIANSCLAALENLMAQINVAPTEVFRLSHGTTVATNALIQRKGSKTALIATEGFTDLLDIRRQVKPDRYDLRKTKPEPLVPSELRIGARERTLADGSVSWSLNDEEVKRLLDLIADLETESVALALLHSYKNAQHEDLIVSELRRRFPGLYVCASHEVSPEFREYPRTSTTVINAYVGPLVDGYLKNLSAGAESMGIAAPLTIFQSNGGLSSASGAIALPVRLLFSGPAGGVHAAAELAGQLGIADAVTLDMGGTSCDVSLIRHGEPELTSEREICGLPVRTQMIDVHSIGAGGGSIAWVDAGGLMHVGPQSAGADPGPAAYGRGGDAATVTDANIVLGRLHSDYLLGGGLRTYPEQSREVLTKVARKLSLTVEECALGVVRVVNANMVGAVRVISVERGYDHRGCALIAFGGAGPLHAVDLATQLDMRTVIVPPAPGVFCAQGVILADYRSDFAHTDLMPLDESSVGRLREVFNGLKDQAEMWARKHGVAAGQSVLERSIDLRYVGQSHQLPIAIRSLTNSAIVEELLNEFHRAHEEAYGYSRSDASVEAVDFRLSLRVPAEKPTLAPPQATSTAAPLVGERDIWFDGWRGPVSSQVYRRDLLQDGANVIGPAVVEQYDTTTIIAPGWSARGDTLGNLIIERDRD
jgi:N-methylhydantoinase A